MGWGRPEGLRPRGGSCAGGRGQGGRAGVGLAVGESPHCRVGTGLLMWLCAWRSTPGAGGPRGAVFTGDETPICTGLVAISIGLRICAPNRCSVGCPTAQLCLHAALIGAHLHARLMPHFCIKGEKKKTTTKTNYFDTRSLTSVNASVIQAAHRPVSRQPAGRALTEALCEEGAELSPGPGSLPQR